MLRTSTAICAFAALSGAAARTLPSNETLAAAFAADEWTDVAWASYNGFRGVALESQTGTLLVDGSPKKALYTEGDAYSMGYLTGLLLEEDVATTVTEYEKLVIPYFIDGDLAAEMESVCAASPRGLKCQAWQGLLSVFQQYLEWATNKSVDASIAAGEFPDFIVDEVQGLVDGCAAANPDTEVTVANVQTIGTGMDVLMANILTGTLPHEVLAFAERSGAPAEVIELAASLSLGDYQWPAYCNAFAAGPDLTAEGTGAIYARDFQLPVADTLQYVAHLHLRIPDTDERAATVSMTFPGAVGSITAMNEHGMAMGLNTLRSGFASSENVGVGGLLNVRATMDMSDSTDAAVDYVADSVRGCPYLFSVADSTGASAILEVGANSESPPDLLSFAADDPDLLPLLPDADYLAAHASSEYKNGVYVRRDDYKFDTSFLDFNEGLFAYANATDLYEAAEWGSTGHVFPSWDVERNDTELLTNNWFINQREDLDQLVFVTNNAVTPEMQLTQMNLFSDLLEHSGESITWRYDTWNEQLQAAVAAKNITFESARDELIMFLAPDRLPGYWDNYLDPADPMSAEIEGALSVADLDKLVFTSLWGYYEDSFVTMTLANYL